MKSVTKAVLTEEKVRALTEKAFPGEEITEVRELTEGMFNTAYFVKGSGALERGAVLKVGPAEGTKVLTYEKDIIKTEIAMYKALEPTAVPVPRVLFEDDSKSDIPSTYFFMDYIPGVLWKDAEEEKLKACRPALMRQVGKIFSETHSVLGTHFGYIKEDPHYQFTSWSEAYKGMLTDICEDGRRGGKDLPYGEILAMADKYRGVLNEVKEPHLVNFDMWAGNIMLRDEGETYTVCGVFDLERAFFGDPCADFISSVMVFDDVTNEPDLAYGYEGELPLSGNASIRMDLYRLYLMVIMFVETYRFDEEYAKGTEGWIRPILNELLKKLG